VSLRRAIGSLSTRMRCTRMSKGGLTPRYDDRCIPVARWRGRMTAKSTRHHALGRMAVSGLEMMYFSLCKIAQSEPSRSGAGTWRRQVQSKTAPRCRRVRVHHEAMRIRESGSNGQDEHAGLAYSMERWTSFTSAAPRTSSQLFGPHQEQHEAPAGTNQAHNMAQRPGEQGPQQTARMPQGGS
jgi:hypothetical protein